MCRHYLNNIYVQTFLCLYFKAQSKPLTFHPSIYPTPKNTTPNHTTPHHHTTTSLTPPTPHHTQVHHHTTTPHYTIHTTSHPTTLHHSHHTTPNYITTPPHHSHHTPPNYIPTTVHKTVPSSHDDVTFQVSTACQLVKQFALWAQEADQQKVAG